MTVALIVVVAISLSLLGTGLLFVKQVNHTRALWQSKVELSIYLCDNNPLSPQCTRNGPATTAQTHQIQSTLRRLPQVVDVTYQSQEANLSQFRKEFAYDPVFSAGVFIVGRLLGGLAIGAASVLAPPSRISSAQL